MAESVAHHMDTLCGELVLNIALFLYSPLRSLGSMSEFCLHKIRRLHEEGVALNDDA